MPGVACGLQQMNGLRERGDALAVLYLYIHPLFYRDLSLRSTVLSH